MTDRIPARTNKGRDVLLDRNIELDGKLRTVLAQCDGKRDAEQIKARFGAMIDVDAALLALRELGLIETANEGNAAAVQPASVLQAALGAAVNRSVAAAANSAAAEAPVVRRAAPVAPVLVPATQAAPPPPAQASPVRAPVLPASVAPAVTPASAPAVTAAPAVEAEAVAADEVDDDPFAEWFPPSMRKSKGRAA